MSEQNRSSPGSRSCAQVWAQLGADRQNQIIRLMAQLAFNWLMVQLMGLKRRCMMLSQLAEHKIQPEHLDRQALIYVRQSTLAQVMENTGSKARQYDLVQRALELGWPQEHIVVIDQDQGRSGASAADRAGFQHLVAEVGLGHAGAVFSLEASRLARSCSDWYRLIEICALSQTLVIDEEGVYDPSQYNDRLLLGFKGTMSEAELHWLRNRLMNTFNDTTCIAAARQ